MIVSLKLLFVKEKKYFWSSSLKNKYATIFRVGNVFVWVRETAPVLGRSRLLHLELHMVYCTWFQFPFSVIQFPILPTCFGCWRSTNSWSKNHNCKALGISSSVLGGYYSTYPCYKKSFRSSFVDQTICFTVAVRPNNKGVTILLLFYLVMLKCFKFNIDFFAILHLRTKVRQESVLK